MATTIVEVLCPRCRARETLPPEAVAILEAAARAGNGILAVNTTSQGTLMQAGEVDLLDRTDSRKEAAYIEALTLLMDGEYLTFQNRARSDVLRAVTNRGYSVLDAIANKG